MRGSLPVGGLIEPLGQSTGKLGRYIVHASRSRAGLIARHADIADRLRAERYFAGLAADGSLCRAGGSLIPGCNADAGPGTGHGHLAINGAGAGGDRGG